MSTQPQTVHIAATMRPKRRIGKRATLRERDGDNCWLCGEVIDFSLPSWTGMGPTIDHVIPRCKGGVRSGVKGHLAKRSSAQSHAGTAGDDRG